MRYFIQTKHPLAKRSDMLYGQFLEHFHRQVYPGVYDPASPLSGENGFRGDVISALREISTPVIRWPGGCFVSDYHWRDGVINPRAAKFNRAWRVTETNAFGTDEFVSLCRELGCEPYICTNAGTGSAEEMAEWVEYCNLADQSDISRLRAENGFMQPYKVKLWSIGNENYGSWEIGAKTAEEWGCLVRESAKMMRRTDPSIELSAAALDDIDWNINLLKQAGEYLQWISIHRYWDSLVENDDPADYEACMAYTYDLDAPIRHVRGLLTALGLEKRIRIAVDEWNLRSWHHPNIMTVKQGLTPEEYLSPRDRNDLNSTYTMADAVFSACFLNTLLRNSDMVGMANFAPCVNGRGLIYTYPDGIVKRSTWYVFKLYAQYMGDTVINGFCEGDNSLSVHKKHAGETVVDCLDLVATSDSKTGEIAVSAINKHPTKSKELTLDISAVKSARVYTVNGPDANSYNDVDGEPIQIKESSGLVITADSVSLALAPHSVNVIRLCLI